MGKNINYFALAFMAAAALFAVPSFSETAKGRGYCGDGVINGNEDCDGGDLKIHSCKVLNGGEGHVKCQPNCVYDISQCGSRNSESDLAGEINEKVGGIAEVCKCTCNNDNCDGGCVDSSLEMSMVDCFYRCNNNCTCRCEGRLEAHIEYCNMDCQCTNNSLGKPECACNLDECEMIVATDPNIGTLVTQKAPFPLGG